MSTDLQFYSSDDVTPNPTLTFAPENGTPTAAQTLRLWNDQGGALSADTAEDILITALSRDSGSGAYSWEHVVAASRWVEARLVDADGDGIAQQVTSWTPVGRGAAISARPIPSDCARTVEVRVAIPAGAGSLSVQVLLRAFVGAISLPVGQGHYEGGPGVLAGVGDGLFSALLSGGEITPNSPADDAVDVSDAVGVLAGMPFYIAGDEIILDDEDGSAATLGSGESYPATLSIGDDGAGGVEIHVTKGDLGVEPLDPDVWPAAPEGDLLLGHVERPFGGEVEAADIDQTVRRYGGYHLEHSTSSRIVRIHGGRAALDDRLAARDSSVTRELAASDESWIWLRPDGEYDVTLVAQPVVPRSLALWRATTDASGVTAVVDLRPWTVPGGVSLLRFSVRGALAAAAADHAVLPGGPDWWILPLGALTVGLGNPGSTSGATDVELELSEGGGTWESVLAAPVSIAESAADPVAIDAQPVAFRLAGGTRLRARVDDVPGTPSENLAVTLLVCRPGC